jgi:integrase/recombinase XerD
LFQLIDDAPFTLLTHAIEREKQMFEGQEGGPFWWRASGRCFGGIGKGGNQTRRNFAYLMSVICTHLPEQGTDLRYIQELLNHSFSKTTKISIHVTRHGLEKIISPMDGLNI